jgi:hypothetical protein
MSRFVSIMFIALAACEPDSLPASSFDVTVTYDGTRSTGTVHFPEYPVTDLGPATDHCGGYDEPQCQPAPTISGTITSGTLPIVELELGAYGPGERTFTIDVQRDAADDAAYNEIADYLPYAVATIPEERLGTATACTHTTRSCSVLLVERAP